MGLFSKLLEKKSGTLPSKEQEAYFATHNRMEYFNFSKTDQDLIVSTVFQNRYLLYSNTQPVKTAIDYIALGLQNIPIKLMKRSKSTERPDEVIEDKELVLKCNFNNPSSIYNPTIENLLHQLSKRILS